MKKYILLAIIAASMAISLSSCFHDNNLSISVSDDEDEYEMDASFQNRKTHAVQVYVNDHLLTSSSKWRNGDEVEKEITLDDNTNFSINASPGELRINIDKTKNSEQSCEKIKQACEDIKDLLTDN